MDGVRVSFYQNKSSLLFVRIHVMDENDYQEKDFKSIFLIFVIIVQETSLDEELSSFVDHSY